ncbi:alpha/beta hydrolase fold domain-containing protein [Leptobacterium flavescens]|uniref:Alpha/beta hydrolase fold domain-containing protein n=1 Tax=Leptobacterium flavescens TaxID=472055 RepID=A0A6P0UTA6_9FLAO|nr:alpha/beta hydrolase [Leptobacterium flavescens]NER15069.1 alpha/beta hydrolase fold domain-containing protein [Leptobacterium flavescens]
MMTPDNQLKLRSRHPDFQEFLDFNENESVRVKKSYRNHLDRHYGKAALQTMDIFPSNVSDSPIHVFIHGGYWRALDKKSYSFVAEPFVKSNITVCIVNYRLIPTVDMETLLSDITSAINWIRKEAVRYNGDPNAMVLSGHSAGGHLALMAYLMNEGLRTGIRGICSLSGIFDLDPIRNSYLNEVLNLSEKDVDAFSVSNKDLSVLQCPVLLSVGAAETDFFIEQSRSLYTQNNSKAPLEYYEYEQLNHYQIVHKLGQEDNPLTQFIIKKANG